MNFGIKKNKGEYMGFLANYWEYVLIGFLLVDKIVALSPSKMDDLLWFSIKKMLKKAAGK